MCIGKLCIILEKKNGFEQSLLDRDIEAGPFGSLVCLKMGFIIKPGVKMLMHVTTM